MRRALEQVAQSALQPVPEARARPRLSPRVILVAQLLLLLEGGPIEIVRHGPTRRHLSAVADPRPHPLLQTARGAPGSRISDEKAALRAALPSEHLAGHIGAVRAAREPRTTKE